MNAKVTEIIESLATEVDPEEDLRAILEEIQETLDVVTCERESTVPGEPKDALFELASLVTEAVRINTQVDVLKDLRRANGKGLFDDPSAEDEE